MMFSYRDLFSQACKQGLPPHEVQLLLEHLTALSRTALLLRMDDPAPDLLVQQLNEMVQQRLTGYPLQYLLGEWEFFGLPFFVGEGVLIPRADTEVLVETALELCDGMFSPQVCDLCSGSGCIPIALSRHLPEQASLTAVELSDAALGYLQKNVQRHHCSNLTMVQADVLTWQPQQLFDLITSNPPYISDQEMLELQPEVRWEPEMALRAQENGLYFYRVLSKRCQSYLRTGGWLLFEIGYTQGQAVSDLLLGGGYPQYRVRQLIAHPTDSRLQRQRSGGRRQMAASRTITSYHHRRNLCKLYTTARLFLIWTEPPSIPAITSMPFS